MPVAEKIQHIFEPTPLQCGQAVLAMLSGRNVRDIAKFLDNDRETNLKEMFRVLDSCGIGYDPRRVPVKSKEELPPVCILSLETPKCWHWSLWYKGSFYDPEYGILKEFPPSNRRYYWKISEYKNETQGIDN